MTRSLLPLALALTLAACGQTSAPSAPSEEDADAPAVATPAPSAAETATPDDAPAASPKQAAADVSQLPVNDRIDRVLGDHRAYEDTINAFQQAVASKNAQAVADMVQYPLNVMIDGAKVSIDDESEFVANYDRIVTPAVSEIVTQQKYDSLFVNQRGVMFGSGEAHINGVCLDNACNKVEVKVVGLRPQIQP